MSVLSVCAFMCRSALRHENFVALCLKVVPFFIMVVCMHACVGVRVSLPCVSEHVCLKNGSHYGYVGFWMGKTPRSAITLKHAGPYLCHEA